VCPYYDFLTEFKQSTTVKNVDPNYSLMGGVMMLECAWLGDSKVGLALVYPSDSWDICQPDIS
jgi:hypothetical protein